VAETRRVYLPGSVSVLRTLAAGRSWAPGRGFAVTSRLREEDPRAEEEEVEFAAFLDAAAAALGCVESAGAPRRVVVAADVEAAAVRPIAEADAPTAVTVAGPVVLERVAAVHVDEAAAQGAVAAALAAQDPRLLDEVPLLWFAPVEIEALLAEVGGQAPA
jgi:hypothetical protein